MKECPSCHRQFPDDLRYCPRDKSSLFQVKTVFEGAVIQQKYRVESVLGIGGMSTVYKVEQLIFHEKMAMKVMSSDCAGDKTFRKRFEDEARIIRQLQSSFGRNIVRIEDVGETEDGLPFVVMEYVPGESLSRLISPDETPESRQPLELAHALKIAAQICDALEVAHGHKVVHRDIKPENILIADEDGVEVVKVLDFGIAKFDYADPPAPDRGSAQSEFMGSPHYCSPEQAARKSDKHIDGRSDLYSLGVVVYEMLTGQQPFPGENDQEVLSKQVRQMPESPDVLNPELSDSAVALTMKALAKAPADRFQSAAEMRNALVSALQSMGDVAVRPAGPEYTLCFTAEDGDVEYNVPIGHGETLASVLTDLIDELSEQGVRLKYHQHGGSLQVTSNERELDHAVPLRRQGVRSGDTLHVRSIHVQQKADLENWIREYDAPEKLLELSLESLQACRDRNTQILGFEPALGKALLDLEKKLADLAALKGTMQKRDPVAGLAAAEKLLATNPGFGAAEILRTRAIRELINQLTSLIEQLQFEDASKMLVDIESTTKASDFFADLNTRLQKKSAALEASLREVMELVAQGDLERGRTILQSFRAKPQLSNGRSVTRILSEYDTTPVWVQGIARLVAEEKWKQARAALSDRTSIFRLWPPFFRMLAALNALEIVQERVKKNIDVRELRHWFSAMADSGLLDFRWARALNLESSSPDSLAGLARQIVIKIGMMVGGVEKQQQVAEEDKLRQSFIAGIRELSHRDPRDAQHRLERVLASDPHPHIAALRGELKYV